MVFVILLLIHFLLLLLLLILLLFIIFRAGRSPAGIIFPETSIRRAAVRSAGSDWGGDRKSDTLQERSVC